MSFRGRLSEDRNQQLPLTDRQQELLQEFEEISQGNAQLHSPRAQSWLDRV